MRSTQCANKSQQMVYLIAAGDPFVLCFASALCTTVFVQCTIIFVPYVLQNFTLMGNCMRYTVPLWLCPCCLRTPYLACGHIFKFFLMKLWWPGMLLRHTRQLCLCHVATW